MADFLTAFSSVSNYKGQLLIETQIRSGSIRCEPVSVYGGLDGGLSPYYTEKRDPTRKKSTPKQMKCTWPTRKLCVGDPTQPIFHWLTLGFCIGGNANFSTFRYPTQNCGIGGLSQHQDPTRMVLHCSGIKALPNREWMHT